MSASTASYDSALRPGPAGLLVEAIGEVWSRRRLIGYLVRADLKKKGADTLLGNLWWVIDPLLQMLVYVILVTVIFARSTPDYPLFVFAAILPWKWFSSAVNDSVVSVTSQERLIKQVQFPKIILPVAAVVAGIANFAFGLIPLAAMMVLFYSDRISAWVVLIPAVAIVQLVFTLAAGVFLSAVNVFFRDIGNLARHFLRIWFYLSPALYSAKQVEELTTRNPLVGSVLQLNPFTPIFESYRNLIYYGSAPLWGHLGGVVVLSLALVGLAVLFFKRLEPTYAKVL